MIDGKHETTGRYRQCRRGRRRGVRSGIVRAPGEALAVALALTMAASGCATLDDKQLEQMARRDAVLTTEVKGALIASPQVGAASIRVTLEGRTLVLAGFVDDEGERAEAARIARRTAELTIDNRLEVR